MDPTQTLKSSTASKLPIKRKTPPNSFTSSAPDSPPPAVAAVHGGCNTQEPAPPPFKFHRIWTESDEIRFLQGLLDCAAESLAFPRDLNVFYTRFSSTMSQPYTKSQLSEKLRRLRKKFRVISARLAKGHDWSLLSPHDRALYDISKRLWHPDFAATSPFCYSSGAEGPRNSGGLVGVAVSFMPSLPSVLASNHSNNNANEKANDEIGLDGDVKLREVNVEFDDDDGIVVGKMANLSGLKPNCGVGEATAKVVVDVFDECLKELRKDLVGEKSNLDASFKQGNVESFEERWRKQRVAELDVFSKRMREYICYYSSYLDVNKFFHLLLMKYL
ncbi:PREDICTED: probable transcription factor At5g28040 [Ipomoea nil]|uniref:probable transcription factor At5g28040 n=1 Tax=Ipomoea nil TaxID=35883 RepID=UPI000900EF1A|nr:PREDICTED: probable transcription factor At5g28040 [Ipomoea nil]